MNLSFFTSIFKKNSETLSSRDSKLIKQLKEVSDANSFSLFNNITIFHHTKSYHILLLLLDESRGLYIIEKREWSYGDLKNATVEKAQDQKSSNVTLFYQKTQNLINQKFNELTHHDSVPIFNYLLMENLNSGEYELLDDSFKELLPYKRVILNDSTHKEILNKLQDAKLSDVKLPSKNDILGNLLIQYTILNKDNTLQICTQEQIDFIDAEISGLATLNAVSRSGKSNSLLLKAILHILKNKNKKIIIIKPTLLSCDILKKKLVDIIEHAIIEINLTQISILTPIELVNLHLKKLNKIPIEEKLHIDTILLKKNFQVAELIMCDDSNLYEDDFIAYLTHIQSNANLLLVNTNDKNATHQFTNSFVAKHKKFIFHKANQYEKVPLVVANFLLVLETKSVIVVGNSASKDKIYRDLKEFIHKESSLLDSSWNLIHQSLDSILLANYRDINELDADHLILIDTCSSNFKEAEYAIGLAKKSVTIIYEEACETIKFLKEKYENNQE